MQCECIYGRISYIGGACMRDENDDDDDEEWRLEVKENYDSLSDMRGHKVIYIINFVMSL